MRDLQSLLSWAGMRIVTSRHLVVLAEDWSRVRSRSRAARRQRQGHRQNIIRKWVADPNIIVSGDAMFMHPDTHAKLIKRCDEQGVFL